MNAHDILKQKLLDTEEDHTTGITREEVLCIQSKLESLHGELVEAVNKQHEVKMPDLRKLQPTHFHDCTGSTNGVGKITAPQPIDDYSSDDLQWMTGTGRWGQ